MKATVIDTIKKTFIAFLIVLNIFWNSFKMDLMVYINKNLNNDKIYDLHGKKIIHYLPLS